MVPTITDQPSVPATTAPPPRRRALYLVGEAERSTPRPAAIVGRTTISVNGRWTSLRGRTVTYRQLLRIVFPDREGQTPLAGATISYRHPVDQSLSGLLAPGDAIPLADGLLVNVNATYAS
ncbi:hypothetical protein [Sphingomonas adhaesiva]|uniref:hypothetical protein n=1 Tax=Sphingomonas adhaesiva TaxID=28212 RepID=UPI000B088461|nr:hypothetical protein [Sphingomonas adhaesiva]